MPVLCDDIEASKSFTYAAICLEIDAGATIASGSLENCGCSCLNGCSEVDDCPCKLLLPGTSVNMRECGSACACSANRCCQNSPVFNGLTCRLLIHRSGAKGLGKRFVIIFVAIYLASAGKYNPQSKLYELDENLRKAAAYHLFGLLWTKQFLVGIAQVSISFSLKIFFNSLSDTPNVDHIFRSRWAVVIFRREIVFCVCSNSNKLGTSRLLSNAAVDGL